MVWLGLRLTSGAVLPAGRLARIRPVYRDDWGHRCDDNGAHVDWTSGRDDDGSHVDGWCDGRVEAIAHDVHDDLGGFTLLSPIIHHDELERVRSDLQPGVDVDGGLV